LGLEAMYSFTDLKSVLAIVDLSVSVNRVAASSYLVATRGHTVTNFAHLWP